MCIVCVMIMLCIYSVIIIISVIVIIISSSSSSMFVTILIIIIVIIAGRARCLRPRRALRPLERSMAIGMSKINWESTGNQWTSMEINGTGRKVMGLQRDVCCRCYSRNAEPAAASGRALVTIPLPTRLPLDI